MAATTWRRVGRLSFRRRIGLIAAGSVLERSSIRPPRSIYDPNDRFTHTNFPGALTKDEAIDLVRHAGDAGYRLPLSG